MSQTPAEKTPMTSADFQSRFLEAKTKEESSQLLESYQQQRSTEASSVSLSLSIRRVKSELQISQSSENMDPSSKNLYEAKAQQLSKAIESINKKGSLAPIQQLQQHRSRAQKIRRAFCKPLRALSRWVKTQHHRAASQSQSSVLKKGAQQAGAQKTNRKL
jgi:hypothetical protein